MSSQSGIRRAVATATALAIAFSGLSLSIGAAPAAAAGSPLGVYVGAAKPSRVSDFNQWLGRDVTWAMDYFSGESWETIESPEWWIDSWANTPYKMIWSIPMLPDNAGTLAEGATGAYNEHFRKLAQLLVEKGEGDSVLRIGWEMNGNWFRWAASKNPTAFVDYWREIVKTMRSVPGANFKFDWCPNGGPTDMPADRVYPGDAWVDYIGQDTYDAWWGGEPDAAKRWSGNMSQPYGLQWQRDFAKAHGKPMTFAEWGLWLRDDGNGGGDAPYYIQKMHDWINDNNVAFAIYFEYDGPDGDHRLSNNQFPKSAAKFVDLFGPSAPAPAPSPSNTPAPTPTATPSPAPTATPTPRPTNTPAPAPTNTPAPTPTSPAPGGGVPPSATPTPTPSPTPTSTPSVPPGSIVGGPAPVPVPDSVVTHHDVQLCTPCLVKSGTKFPKWRIRHGSSKHHRFHRRHPHAGRHRHAHRYERKHRRFHRRHPAVRHRHRSTR
jgi:hypothetical protein